MAVSDADRPQPGHVQPADHAAGHELGVEADDRAGRLAGQGLHQNHRGHEGPRRQAPPPLPLPAACRSRLLLGQELHLVSQVADMWQAALRANYTPVVHVAKVKAKSDKAKAAEARGDKHAALSAAVAETLKYAVKPEDMLTDGAFLFGITDQLHKLRFIATGGVLKDWLKEAATDEEMVETGTEPDEAEAQPDLPGMTFGWQPGERKYRRVKGPR